MLPIASQIATRNTAAVARSALPGAPTIPDPPPREPRLRIARATVLRGAARRQRDWADRLDPRLGACT